MKIRSRLFFSNINNSRGFISRWFLDYAAIIATAIVFIGFMILFAASGLWIATPTTLSSSIDDWTNHYILMVYLQTPLPATLPDLVRKQSNSAADLLISHPELWQEKTYAQFIEYLSVFGDEATKEFLFVPVTKALFIQSDYTSISVDYPPFESQGDDLYVTLPRLQGPSSGSAAISNIFLPLPIGQARITLQRHLQEVELS